MHATLTSVDSEVSMFGRLRRTLSAEDITEWLTCDNNDPGYHHLSDEECLTWIWMLHSILC